MPEDPDPQKEPRRRTLKLKDGRYLHVSVTRDPDEHAAGEPSDDEPPTPKDE